MTTPSKPDLVALADELDSAIENHLYASVSNKEACANLLREVLWDNKVGISKALRHLASQPSLYEAGREEIGWLIEQGDPPVYYTVHQNDYDEHWTSDAAKALRFACREDAQAYVDHIGWTSPPVRVIEHLWPALPADGGEVKTDQRRDEPDQRKLDELRYGLREEDLP